MQSLVIVLPFGFPAGPPPDVIWRSAPDDFSLNCVEICLFQSDKPTVTLTSPDGQFCTICLNADHYADIQCGSTIIGGVHRWPDRRGWTKLRITLAPTAWRADGKPPAPFGDWKLQVSAKVDAQLWILRDDADRVAQQGAPLRPSVFFDPAYRERDTNGDYCLDDSTTGQLRRSGTASLLTTAQHQTRTRQMQRRRMTALSPLPTFGQRLIVPMDRLFDLPACAAAWSFHKLF